MLLLLLLLRRNNRELHNREDGEGAVGAETEAVHARSLRHDEDGAAVVCDARNGVARHEAGERALTERGRAAHVVPHAHVPGRAAHERTDAAPAPREQRDVVCRDAARAAASGSASTASLRTPRAGGSAHTRTHAPHTTTARAAAESTRTLRGGPGSTPSCTSAYASAFSASASHASSTAHISSGSGVRGVDESGASRPAASSSVPLLDLFK